MRSPAAKPDSRIESLVRRVRSEYREMPGLQLTPLQFCRLFGMSPAESEDVIACLIADHFLLRTSHGGYGRAEPWRMP
ncbi:MAG: hypothetical protein KJ066_06050 [Acidobacteria bacterium]|nr:hypothetical protein [Acidobacteriota bacterium]